MTKKSKKQQGHLLRRIYRNQIRLQKKVNLFEIRLRKLEIPVIPVIPDKVTASLIEEKYKLEREQLELLKTIFNLGQLNQISSIPGRSFQLPFKPEIGNVPKKNISHSWQYLPIRIFQNIIHRLTLDCTANWMVIPNICKDWRLLFYKGCQFLDISGYIDRWLINNESVPPNIRDYIWEEKITKLFSWLNKCDFNDLRELCCNTHLANHIRCYINNKKIMSSLRVLNLEEANRFFFMEHDELPNLRSLHLKSYRGDDYFRWPQLPSLTKLDIRRSHLFSMIHHRNINFYQISKKIPNLQEIYLDIWQDNETYENLSWLFLQWPHLIKIDSGLDIPGYASEIPLKKFLTNMGSLSDRMTVIIRISCPQNYPNSNTKCREVIQKTKENFPQMKIID